MAKKVINSMNAGELSPYLYARSDYEKYDSGCIKLENFIPLPYGGVTRRPAIEYLGDTSDTGTTTDKVRLIPFIPAVDSAYMLEFGDLYVRVWEDGAYTGVELVTPYLESELNDVKFCQSVDVMWFVHPNHEIMRLSRVGDSSWSFEEEGFNVPPLLEENEEDLKIYTDALTGDATLTSTADFFDAGHVGGYMFFSDIRVGDAALISQQWTTSLDGITDELYVSNANWSMSVTAAGTGKTVVQRSLDGGETWEDYVVVSDTTGGTATSTSFSSDAKEPAKTRLRILFVRDANGTMDFNLKTGENWLTVVKITAFTDARSVDVEVIDEFQKLTTDYTDWQGNHSSYSLGDLVKVDGALTIGTTGGGGGGTFDDCSTAITGTSPRGATHDGTDFWFVNTNGDVSQVDGTYTQVTNWNASSTTSPKDVAHDGTHVYVVGSRSSGPVYYVDIDKYTTAGSYVSTVTKTYSSLGTHIGEGLEYYDGYFYLGIQAGTSTKILKMNSSFANIKQITITGGNAKAVDFAGYDGDLYVLNFTDDTLDVYDTDLNPKLSHDISAYGGTDKQGVAWDGTDLRVLNGAEELYIWEVGGGFTGYYESVRSTTYTSAADFQTDYDLGYWAERTPEMKKFIEGAFSDYRGHPNAIALFENRLCYGGSATAPNTVWLSEIDNYNNFLLDTTDTGAMKVVPNSGGNDEIKWMAPQERLVIGTSTGEWALGSSDERKAINTAGFDLKAKTSYGSNNLQGILVNSSILFVMRQGRKVREWSPQYNIQEFVAQDLSILAEHITDGGVLAWSYQQQPDNILWGVRGDGTLLGFTYERDQNVAGWHRHVNDQFTFESVAVLPREDEEDEVWVAVKATIDGTEEHYIGRLNDREWGADHTTEWQGSDLYVTYSSPGSATLTGLEHLEGEDVVVIGDGVPETTTKTVASGQITADDTYTYAVVGLPFTSTVAPMYLDIEGEHGTTHGDKKDAMRATVRFKDTYSAKAGQSEGDLEVVDFDSYSSALFNEEAEVWFGNESAFLQTMYIVQDEPMPCTVLSVIPRVEVRR